MCVCAFVCVYVPLTDFACIPAHVQALLQVEESLRIRMVHLPVHHQSTEEDLELTRRVCATSKFLKKTNCFRAFEVDILKSQLDSYFI